MSDIKESLVKKNWDNGTLSDSQKKVIDFLAEAENRVTQIHLPPLPRMNFDNIVPYLSGSSPEVLCALGKACREASIFVNYKNLIFDSKLSLKERISLWKGSHFVGARMLGEDVIIDSLKDKNLSAQWLFDMHKKIAHKMKRTPDENPLQSTYLKSMLEVGNPFWHLQNGRDISLRQCIFKDNPLLKKAFLHRFLVTLGTHPQTEVKVIRELVDGDNLSQKAFEQEMSLLLKRSRVDAHLTSFLNAISQEIPALYQVSEQLIEKEKQEAQASFQERQASYERRRLDIERQKREDQKAHIRHLNKLGHLIQKSLTRDS